MRAVSAMMKLGSDWQLSGANPPPWNQCTKIGGLTVIEPDGQLSQTVSQSKDSASHSGTDKKHTSSKKPQMRGIRPQRMPMLSVEALDEPEPLTPAKEQATRDRDAV